MTLFNVYSLYPVEPVRGKGCFVYNAAGTEYLDLYGGHAVISIGHAQPDYVKAISEQAARLEDIFVACSRYEALFWDMAWAGEE